jgi:hypothetical protein
MKKKIVKLEIKCQIFTTWVKLYVPMHQWTTFLLAVRSLYVQFYKQYFRTPYNPTYRLYLTKINTSLKASWTKCGFNIEMQLSRFVSTLVTCPVRASPGNRLFRLRIFVVSLSTYRKMARYYIHHTTIASCQALFSLSFIHSLSLTLI